MPKAPHLGWSIAVYYAIWFLAGVWMAVDRAYHMPSAWEVTLDGLWLLLMGNLFFFIAPWIHKSWISWVIVVSISGGIVFAWLKLSGWRRWISVMTLIVCLNSYSLYSVVLAHG